MVSMDNFCKNRLTIRFSFLLLVSASIAACGFQLRGTNLEGLRNSKVYIQSSGTSTLATELRQQLLYSDVPITKSSSEADYIIAISNERFDRKVLSVSANTGKVEEYELLYRADLTVTGPDGKQLIKSEPVAAQRDYVFEEGSVIASFDQEQILQREISKHAASTVLRRLQAVIK